MTFMKIECYYFLLEQHFRGASSRKPHVLFVTQTVMVERGTEAKLCGTSGHSDGMKIAFTSFLGKEIQLMFTHHGNHVPKKNRTRAKILR
jgi:hypothetical protein